MTVRQHVVAARVVGCSSLAPFFSGILVFPVVYLVSSLGLSAVRPFIFLVLPIKGDIVLFFLWSMRPFSCFYAAVRHSGLLLLL